MIILEILQFENTFNLEMIGEEGDTQLNLKWVNLDEKRNREDYCEVSKTKELRKRVVGLVEKLVGGKKVEIVIEVGKYVGEIEKLIPNGQGTYELPNGKKYVGKWKDGKYNGEGTFTRSNGTKYIGKFKDGIKNGQGILTSYLGV